MAEYDNTNTGVIYINKRKETETHPDRTGSVNVEGVEYWVNGWIKESPKVEGPFLSLSLKKKEPKDQQQEQRQPQGDGTPF